MIGLDSTSLSYFIVILSVLLLWIVTQIPFYLWVFTGVLLLAGVVHLAKLYFGTEGIYGRPKGACGCDLLCTSENDEGKPGFPSGHVATSWMLFLVFAWYIRAQLLIPFSIIGLTWSSLVSYSRYIKKCHNIPQIIGGYVAGTIGAILFIATYNATHRNGTTGI